jgi:hypothetical protein
MPVEDVENKAHRKQKVGEYLWEENTSKNHRWSYI